MAAIGGLTIPSMLKQGYDKNFSSAMTAAAGSIGVIIPPSIPMVMYCVATGASVGALFMAGFLPGILIGVSLCLYSSFYCKKHGYINKDAAPFSWGNVGYALKDGVWALLVPVIILGGIYGGIFTPTEAAAVAVAYGLVVGLFVYRDLKLKDLYRIFASRCADHRHHPDHPGHRYHLRPDPDPGARPHADRRLLRVCHGTAALCC